GALGTRAAEASKTLKDPKSLITDMRTRAALGFAFLQMVSPQTLLEEGESMLDGLREGLDPDALQSLEAALIAEVTEVYPEQMVPPSAAEAFIFFEAKQAEPAPQAAPETRDELHDRKD